MGYYILCLFVTIVVHNFADVAARRSGEIVQLSGEPGYRSVELRWQTIKENSKSDSNSTVHGYSVHYCELQSWGPLRCKDLQKTILPMSSQDPEETGSNLVEEETDESNSEDMTYTMRIGGLRMATTYSFNVKPIRSGQSNRTDRSDDSESNSIIIPTKGFSARATQCLPQASVVEVQTGPYFGGRISVEPSNDDTTQSLEEALPNSSCSVAGDPSNPSESYMLRIDHAKCGSRVNDTTVATFIIVQENLPILTHSTRRFLVLCTFQSEVLTVRAGMSLPPRNAGKGTGEAAVPSPSRRQNNARSLLGNGRAQLVLKSDYDDSLDTVEDDVKQKKHKSRSIEKQFEPNNVHAARLVDAIPAVDEVQVKEVREKSSVSLVLTLIAVGACVSCIAVIVTIKYRKRNHEEIQLGLPITSIKINSKLTNAALDVPERE